MLYFQPQPISEDEMKYRLENPNTEEIFVPECLNYRYGSLGFICDNPTCTGLYCVNNMNEIPNKCIYCGLTKKLHLLLGGVQE